MSVAGHQAPPFFKRGPAPLARLAFFVLLALSLLVLDLRFHYLELVRHAVSAALYPLQRAAYAPIEMIERVGDYFSSVSALQRENAQLRRRELESANWLLRQEHLELENRRLRELLDMRARQAVPAVLAEILYAARDPFSRRVVVDAGSQQGVVGGQAVVDERGVLGQVTRVHALQSEVTLITDKNQAVPVQIVRNGLRAVLFGAGGGELELRFLAANADVVPGDKVVTSGLDGVYQAGLPVARVARVDRDAAYSFARIVCDPAAGVEKYGQVLILGRREGVALPADAVDTPATPKKGKKGRRRD